MPENVFVKFKNLLRGVRSDYKELLDEAKTEELIATDKLKEIIKKAKKEGHKSIEADGKTIGDIFSVNPSEEDRKALVDFLKSQYDVNYYEASILESQNLINAFDNEKAIGYVKDIYMLLSFLITFIKDNSLTKEESSRILGAVIYFNAKKARKVKNDSNVQLYVTLAKYFKPDGTFVFGNDLDGLYTNLKTLCTNYEGFVQFEEKQKGYKSQDLILDIAHLYLDFYRDYEIVAKEDSNTSKILNCTYPLEIRKYYKDGNLISIPEDVDAFVNLLKENDVPDQEIRYILALIKDAKDTEVINSLMGFYANDELEFVRNAAITLEGMKPYEENYYEIKEILKELQTLEDLFASSTCDDDKTYIVLEKDAYIVRLHELIDVQVEIDPINIAFLKNIDGESYFHNDLDNIDKGIRKRVSGLLAKINNDNKKYFRKVFSAEPVGMDLYEVVNSNLHIVFTEIPGNVFLIIGVSTTGNNYREITNRLVNADNRKNIMEIIEAIKDENVKKNYLLEQNAMIPSFSDKRVRKQIDN